MLAIDLGTGSCRSAVFDGSMRMHRPCAVEYPLITISDREVEQDANAWWNAAYESMRGALDAFGGDRRFIGAIAVSSQGISLLAVARDGKPMANAISWLDTRADSEADDLRARFGAGALYRRTGKRISPVYTLPKILWLKNHRKGVFERCWKLMLPLDYIQFRLCGKCVTDRTMASGTMLFDVRERVWMRDVMDNLGIPEEKLPCVGEAGGACGMLRPELADALGLRRDTRVAIGGQDQKCASLGAGLNDGNATASLGTGCAVSMRCDRPPLDGQMRIPFFAGLSGNTWILEGVLNTAAASYQWFRANFAPTMSFEQLNQAAENAAGPNRVRFYPNLQGGSSPNWNDSGGILANLSLSTGIGDAARAVMEGVGYQIRSNLEVMSGIAGRPSEIRLFGGGTKSDLWCRIIAEITGLPTVRLSCTETALIGAAMLARQSIGSASSGEALPDRVFRPAPDRMEAYEAAYRDYEEKRVRYYS